MLLGQIQLIASEDLNSDMKSTQRAVYGIMVPCFFSSFFLRYKIYRHIYNVQKKCIRFLPTEMTALS